MARPSFARSAATTYGTNLAVALLSFVSVLITARALGAIGRGDIAFLTTIAYLTAQLSTLGLAQANANFAAREPDLSPKLAGTSLTLAFVFGGTAALVLGGVMVVFPDMTGEASTGVLLLVLAAIPMLILQEYLMYLVQAHYGFGITNLSWLATPDDQRDRQWRVRALRRHHRDLGRRHLDRRHARRDADARLGGRAPPGRLRTAGPGAGQANARVRPEGAPRAARCCSATTAPTSGSWA